MFDSGAKEALFLHEQGIPFEVIPGVPAAIGAPAYAGVPRDVPGRQRRPRAPARPRRRDRLDAGSGLVGAGADRRHARLLRRGRQVPAILQSLLDAGAEDDRAVALIYRGTLPTQQTVTGTLKSVLEATATDGAGDAALLVVGEVASLRDHLRWFDVRPLFGRRIVVTRSPEQARELADELENLGAQALEAPTFRIEPPEDPEAVDRAAASVDNYQWVLFESATAVNRFFSALGRGPRDLRAFGGVSVCAIGPSTADRLAAQGIKADVVIPEFRVESIGDAVAGRGSLTNQRVLIVRPDHLRDVLADDLRQRGATVTDLVAYRTAPESADSPAAQNLYRLLLDGRIDAVTFTSPTAVTPLRRAHRRRAGRRPAQHDGRGRDRTGHGGRGGGARDHAHGCSRHLHGGRPRAGAGGALSEDLRGHFALSVNAK